ncbi:MAG: DUF4833 domain-containing protein [Chitinophagaceae bacterium]|nr:MAG: DUF4833 domain-containing protein [Chitinophagaceae bacterium]
MLIFRLKLYCCQVSGTLNQLAGFCNQIIIRFCCGRQKIALTRFTIFTFKHTPHVKFRIFSAVPGKLLIKLVAGCSCILLFQTGFAKVLPIEKIHPQADTLPVPAGIKNLLFYLQRSNDSNTVIYELNKEFEKQLSNADPVSVYWIRYEKGGRKENISFIESRFAYGLTARKSNDTNYELRLVSYPAQALYLVKSRDGQYNVFTKINGKLSVLNRIFINVEGGSFWSPNVTYIQLNGVEVGSGKKTEQKIKP